MHKMVFFNRCNLEAYTLQNYYFFLFFGSSGIWTQSLLLARQAIPLEPALFLFFLTFPVGSHSFVHEWPQTEFLLATASHILGSQLHTTMRLLSEISSLADLEPGSSQKGKPPSKFFLFSVFTSLFFYSFIHMCIHCLGHFSLLPPPPSSFPLFPPFQAEPVLSFSPVLLKSRKKQ
jgi:hypothetical protein